LNRWTERIPEGRLGTIKNETADMQRRDMRIFWIVQGKMIKYWSAKGNAS
jgi:hypothetical protein